MGGPVGEDGVHRVFFQVAPQKAHRRADPERSGIGNEKVAADPYRKAVEKSEAFVFDVENVVDIGLRRLAGDELIDVIGFPDALPQDGCPGRNVLVIAVVDGRVMSVFSSKNNGLPAVPAQVLGDLQAPQDADATARRPVVGDDEDTFFVHRDFMLRCTGSTITLLFANVSG